MYTGRLGYSNIFDLDWKEKGASPTGPINQTTTIPPPPKKKKKEEAEGKCTDSE